MADRGDAAGRDGHAGPLGLARGDRPGRPAHPESSAAGLHPPWRHRRHHLLPGALYAYQWTSVSVATTLLYLSPTLVTLGAARFLESRSREASSPRS